MRMLILRRLYAKSPPAQSREGHRAARRALIGLATLLRSWLCAGGVGEQPIFIIGGERSSGHGELCAGGRAAHLHPKSAEKLHPPPPRSSGQTRWSVGGRTCLRPCPTQSRPLE